MSKFWVYRGHYLHTNSTDLIDVAWWTIGSRRILGLEQWVGSLMKMLVFIEVLHVGGWWIHRELLERTALLWASSLISLCVTELKVEQRICPVCIMCQVWFSIWRTYPTMRCSRRGAGIQELVQAGYHWWLQMTHRHEWSAHWKSPLFL